MSCLYWNRHGHSSLLRTTGLSKCAAWKEPQLGHDNGEPAYRLDKPYSAILHGGPADGQQVQMPAYGVAVIVVQIGEETAFHRYRFGAYTAASGLRAALMYDGRVPAEAAGYSGDSKIIEDSEGWTPSENEDPAR
jgi:hypothetical protein